MSKSEVLHELYEQCKDIDFDESFDLILAAPTREEANFIRGVTDLILREKQTRVIAEKRF